MSHGEPLYQAVLAEATNSELQRRLLVMTTDEKLRLLGRIQLWYPDVESRLP